MDVKPIEEVEICGFCKHYSRAGYCKLHNWVKQDYHGCSDCESVWKGLEDG